MRIINTLPLLNIFNLSQGESQNCKIEFTGYRNPIMATLPEILCPYKDSILGFNQILYRSIIKNPLIEGLKPEIQSSSAVFQGFVFNIIFQMGKIHTKIRNVFESVPTQVSIFHPQNLHFLSLDEFAQPFIVAQESSNTYIKMKDRSLLILPKTNAVEIYKSLLDRSDNTSDNKSSYGENTLTFYMGPNHFFLNLKCSSCFQGSPYNENFGLYPNLGLIRFNLLNTGIVKNESSSVEMYNNYLYPKITFYISNLQALDVIKKKQSEEVRTDYHNFRNCIDFTQEFAPILGLSHIFEFSPTVKKAFMAINGPTYKYAFLNYLGTENSDQVAFRKALIFFLIFFIFERNKRPLKSFLKLNSGSSEFYQKGIVFAIRTAVDSLASSLSINGSSKLFMQLVRLSSTSIPFKSLINEWRSVEAINKNGIPSFFSRKVNIHLSVAPFFLMSQIVEISAEILTGNKRSPFAETTIHLLTYTCYLMLAIKILKNQGIQLF